MRYRLTFVLTFVLTLPFIVLAAACGDDTSPPLDGDVRDVGCSEDELCPAGWTVFFDGNNTYCPSAAEDCMERRQCGMEYKCVPDDCPLPQCESNEVQVRPPMGPRPTGVFGSSRYACGRTIDCAACTGPATCRDGEVVLDELDPDLARGVYCSDEGATLYRCQDEAACFSCGDPDWTSGPACTDDETGDECRQNMCGAEAFGCRPVLVCEDVTCEDQTSEVVAIASGPCEEQLDRCVSVACGTDAQVQCTTLCRTGASVISGPTACPTDEYCEAVVHMDEDVWCAGGPIDPECDEPPVCEDGDTAGAASEPCDAPDSCYYPASCGQVIRCERT